MTTSNNTDPHMPVDGSGSLPAGGAGKVDPSIEFTADTGHPAGAASLLRTTAAIRQRAGALLARARRGESQWFRIGSDDALEDAARTVAEVTRERYPWDTIPYHSRWRHFEAGGTDRLKQLDQLLGKGIDARQRARAHIDLVLVSVLLDAGAGPDWHYTEPATGERYTRSEGLGVASFHAFTSGLFSSDPDHPLQADAAGLKGLVTDRLGDAFQVSDVNPLVGLSGRATLLRRLGEAMSEQPETFGNERPAGRPVRCAGRPLWPRRAAHGRDHRAPDPLAAARDRSRASGPRPMQSTASPSTAATAPAASARATRRSRWATAGGTARCAGRGSPMAGCPFTSSRSGSPIRCSSPSNGRA
jgi:hypothetical protein